MPENRIAGDAFLPLRELLERPELLRPPECVLPRLAYRGRTTLLAAPDKAGKSTLAAHGAAALTRGLPYLGGPTTAGCVLWCGLEESPGDAVRRFAELNADPDKVRLLFATPDDLYEKLRATLESWEPDLLLVDSLAEYARVLLGRSPDDGDAAGWGEVVRPLVALCRAADCAILLLHHPRRSDGQYRGSGEIAAAVDCLLEMQPAKPGEDQTTRHFRGRARWPVQDWSLRMQDGRFVVGGGEPLTLDARVLQYIASTMPTGATKRGIRGYVGGRANSADAALGRLMRDGAVVRGSDQRHRIPPPTLPLIPEF